MRTSLIFPGVLAAALLAAGVPHHSAAQVAQPAPPPPAPVPAPAEEAARTIRLPIDVSYGINLDPHLTPAGSSLRLIGDLYEGLMQWTPGEQPALAPCLAKEWPVVSEDGKTYTFKLREAQFHNAPCFEGGLGRKVKAGDVIASFKRLSTISADQGWYWLIKGVIAGLDEYVEDVAMNGGFAGKDDKAVDGLSAPDDATFVLKLSRPFAPILSILAHPACSILPAEAIEHFGTGLSLRPVGTAPYRLNAVLENQLYILKRFEDYWGDKPYFERVTFAPGQKLDAFIGGEFASYDLPLADFRRNVRDGKLVGRLGKLKAELAPTEDDGTYYMAFNMGDPIFGALDDDGKGLRKAIACCIDRARMGEMLMPLASFSQRFCAVRPSNELFPPGCEFYELGKHDEWGVFDVKAGKAALDATKYKGGIDPATGKALKFTLHGGEDASNERMRDVIRMGMEQLGIEFECKLSKRDAFYRALDEGEGQGYLYGWFLDYPDALNIFQLYDSKNIGTGLENRNVARYNVKEFDDGYTALLKLAQKPENREKRKELTTKLAALLLQDRPIVPMLVRKGATVRSTNMDWPNLPHSAFDSTRFIKGK